MEESLPAGFRFHPTDEELITHNLSRKVVDVGFTAKAIVDIDINKSLQESRKNGWSVEFSRKNAAAKKQQEQSESSLPSLESPCQANSSISNNEFGDIELPNLSSEKFIDNDRFSHIHAQNGAYLADNINSNACTGLIDMNLNMATTTTPFDLFMVNESSWSKFSCHGFVALQGFSNKEFI